MVEYAQSRYATGRGTTGGLNARRAGPGSAGNTLYKPVLHLDLDLMSEKFRAGRPNGVDYKNPEKEFYDANAALAYEVQISIVRQLEDRIRDTGRPQKDHEALIYALLDDRFIDFNASGFSVGVDDVLEQSPAKKYYRNLEYGSNVFVGRVIEGFFEGPGGIKTAGQGRSIAGAKDALKLVQTNNFKNPEGTKAGRYNQPDPYGNPSKSSRTAGEFPVNGGGGAERHIEGRGGNHRGPSHPIVIRNPIPAYHYFEDGIVRWKRQAYGPDGSIKLRYERAAAKFIQRGGLIIT